MGQIQTAKFRELAIFNFLISNLNCLNDRKLFILFSNKLVPPKPKFYVKATMKNNEIELILTFFIRNFIQDPIDVHYERLNTDVSVLEKETEEFKVKDTKLSFL